MTESSIRKDPRYKKISRSKFSSRMKLFDGSACVSFATIFAQSLWELSFTFAVLAALLFFSDIHNQTQSAYNTQKQIDELRAEISKLQSGNGSKSDNP